MEIWPTIHGERLALVEDLEGASASDWSRPTACTGWTVHDVLGHMTVATELNPPKFFLSLAKSGFRFNTFTANGVAKYTQGPPSAALDRFRANVGSTTHPPGPDETWLGETILHAEDIRRAIGKQRSYPSDALIAIADSYRSSNLVIGGKRRVEGVRLVATDADWSVGTGPEVTGPMLPIVLAMSGRKGALSELSGAGVAVLQTRS